MVGEDMRSDERLLRPADPTVLAVIPPNISKDWFFNIFSSSFLCSASCHLNHQTKPLIFSTILNPIQLALMLIFTNH